MNGRIMLSGFFVLLLLALSRSALAQSSKPQQLRIAVSTATPHNTPLWVAKDKKIFDKHGLDVQMIFVMGGALAVTTVGYRMVFGWPRPLLASGFNLPAATRKAPSLVLGSA